MTFKPVNQKQSFPDLEKEIIAFWKENKTFLRSLEIRENAEEFNFYDGPPFATGTPHYGHILAGTMKDVIPRYQTMLGKKVERRFGWDCHGLPIEGIVEKKLGISSKKEIDEKVGVFKFNEECRANVFTYVDEWKKSVERMGRWVDMDNDYKTMDVDFMESVWWVFKELYKKWLIYQDYRVVPYSVGMSTPLSNFEVNQGYKDKQDKTITVKFKVVGSQSKYILAWTTTPWTLVWNLGLAVGNEVEYSEILDKKTGETYVLATSRIAAYYKNADDYTLVRSYPGSCLVGLKYEPLYPDFVHLSETNNLPLGQKLGKNVYSVVLGHHVTDANGTWVVHIAPAYGEDDSVIAKEHDLGFVAHIDDNGYTQNLLENNGVWVFDFNELAIETMKKAGLSVKIDTIVHSYPHCWRTDVPLIYRAISAWYVNVEKIKDKMLAANDKINWTPDNLKHGRFGKWLEWARDWNISRNRYWGSAIPVWQSEDKKHEWCVGSIEELYELNKDFGQIEKKDGKFFYTNTGKEIDIHKHFVDDVKIKHPETGVELKRIPEVLDCWFESGSMPYASKHFPFENSEAFKFPADFIAEGIDQTRGWFYTLVVLGAALFDKNPFSNVIVNGTILAADGKKMSKRLQNYTDPGILMDKHGADAMRFYLMNSPAVQAEDMRFSDEGVEEVVKKVILPLWNTYSFFTTYANIDNFEPTSSYTRNNPLDKWIISELNMLTWDMRKSLDTYKLNEAAKPIVSFMDNLTNWYVRRSRKRFWAEGMTQDKFEAYNTLYEVLVTISKIIAPYMPFVSEHIYKNLTGNESVHLEMYPEKINALVESQLSKDMAFTQELITLGLSARANEKIRVRQPLNYIKIPHEVSEYYQDILKEELNVKEIRVFEESELPKEVCKPNARLIGPKFGQNVKFIISEAKLGNFEKLANGWVKVGEFELNAWEFEIEFQGVWAENGNLERKETGNGLVLALSTTITPELKSEWYARDIIRHIQESRKEANYNVDDRIQISFTTSVDISNFIDMIANETLSTFVQNLENADLSKQLEIEDITVNLKLKK